MRLRGWLVSVLVVGCVPAPSGSPDAGARDAGVDAGVDAGHDAGTRDAGVVDAGDPCAGYAITPPAVLHLPRGEEASLTFTARGATFQVTAGELPPGMEFASWGVLSGTPTAAGEYQFELAAWNATCTANRVVTVVVDCPVITVTPPVNSVVNLNATFLSLFTQSGALTPIFFVSDGQLPAWATLGTDGVFAAQPDFAGTYTFRVTAQDSDGCFGVSPPYSISVECPRIEVIAKRITADGGLAPFSLWAARNLLFQRGADTPARLVLAQGWQGSLSIVDGGLPPGVSFDGGFISGAPLVIPPGDSSFTVRAEFQGCSADQVLMPLSCEFLNMASSAAWSPTNYFVGPTHDEMGWVNGSNALGDLEKANFFDVSSAGYLVVDDILVGFGAATFPTEAPNYVELTLFDGTTGLPGETIDGDALWVSEIHDDVLNGRLSSFSQQRAYSPIPASGKFFVSIVVGPFSPAADGGASSRSSFGAEPPGGAAQFTGLSLLSNTDGETTPSEIWERHADGGWFHYGDPDAWNLNASLMIFPNACR